MYASKRSIGKMGVWTKAPADKNAGRKIKHTNNANKRGRRYFAQVVKDASGRVVKTIYHLTGGDTFRISRVKKRLRKSMANQPK